MSMDLRKFYKCESESVSLRMPDIWKPQICHCFAVSSHSAGLRQAIEQIGERTTMFRTSSLFVAAGLLAVSLPIFTATTISTRAAPAPGASQDSANPAGDLPTDFSSRRGGGGRGGFGGGRGGGRGGFGGGRMGGGRVG